MTRWLGRLLRFPATRLVRLSCYIGIVALLLMSWSALVPAALPIVVGMSLGQVLGGLAFLCYLLAILYEMRQNARSAAAEAATGAPAVDSDSGSDTD